MVDDRCLSEVSSWLDWGDAGGGDGGDGDDGQYWSRHPERWSGGHVVLVPVIWSTDQERAVIPLIVCKLYWLYIWINN